MSIDESLSSNYADIPAFESDANVDPVTQISKSFLIGDREGKGVPLAGRTIPINVQDGEKKKLALLQTSTETIEVNIVNPLPTTQPGSVDDKKSALFKKYPEYFSGVDKSRSVEKAKEFYDLNELKFVFDDQCSAEFIKKTKEEVLEICQWASGRELFTKMFEFYPKLKYIQSYTNGCCPYSEIVELCPEEPYYYTYINEDNEQELYFSPGWITHVHELIHLYKAAVDKNGNKDVFKDPTLGLEFHNLEEERVITGFPELNFHPVNENLFHYLAGSPYRSSHEGVPVSRADQPISAVDCVYADALGHLKKIKCNINAPQKIKEKNVHPLTHACYLNNKKMVDYLIKNGADINVVDDYGSPLHASIINPMETAENSCALLRQLIELGIDVNYKDKNNLTPLMLASNSNNLEAMQVLIENGAYIDCEDNYCQTPLMLACRRPNACQGKNKEKFELLMKKKADVNCKNKGGESPLIIALSFENWDFAKCLIDAGADLKHQDKNDNTPLTRAREGNAPQAIVDLLIKN